MHQNFSFPPIPQPIKRCDPQIAPELLSARQVAQLLNISLRSVHNAKSRLPKAVALSSKCIRWKRSELIAFIDGLPAGEGERTEPVQLARARKARQVAGDKTCDPAVSGGHHPRRPAPNGAGKWRRQESNPPIPTGDADSEAGTP